MALSKAPALEPAAGISLESGPARQALAKGEYSIASRALGLATYFLSGALAINISQVLGSPLKAINEDWYNAWIAFTKQSFGLLTMTLTQTFAPTKVIVSGDESVRGQLLKSADGNLILDFPERLVLIANHQIYTDWLYLWWIAYCNGMHGRLYIILKESLKKIPVLGWGMQLSQFIFLKRNWEEDKPNMARSLQKLNKPTDPMWLLLFPEGTNLAPSTRQRSAAWAKKNDISDCTHVLLPRSTGLHFCLDELKDTVEYLYDITVVYEGVPRGQFAQDIFTLQAAYGEGRPPKSVNMHFRRFAVKEIPIHNDKAFELWLRARWREKDLMIENYYRTGKLPADYGGTKYKSGKILRGCGHMEVPIRASHWYEFLQIFAPMGILAMILYIFYGDLPQKFWKSINKQALQASTEDVRQASVQAGRNVKSAGSAMGGLTLDDFFEPGKQEETFKAGAMAMQNLITSPQAQALLNRADFMQAFLSDPQKLVEETITDKQQNFMQQIAQEEAKRKQAQVTPPAGTGFVRPISSRTASSTTSAPTTKKGNFYNQLKLEERNRQGSTVSFPPAKKATFWDSLDAEEKSRQVSSMPSNQPPARPKGTFYQELKAAEAKKNAPPLTNKNLAAKGNFWDAVDKEENKRLGTVFTMSSGSSTKVGTQSIGQVLASNPKAMSTKTAPAKLTQANKTTPSVAKKSPPSVSVSGPSTPKPAPVKAPAKKANTTISAPAQPAKKLTTPAPTPAAKPKPPTTAAVPKPKAGNTTRPVTAGPSKPPQSNNAKTTTPARPALAKTQSSTSVAKPAQTPTASKSPAKPKPLAPTTANTPLKPNPVKKSPAAPAPAPVKKAATGNATPAKPATATATGAAKKAAPKPAPTISNAVPKLPGTTATALGNSPSVAKKKPPALNGTAKAPPKLKT
jgi:1-acyl-sn-glycerol-3-phosphate acyltransferase